MLETRISCLWGIGLLVGLCTAQPPRLLESPLLVQSIRASKDMYSDKALIDAMNRYIIAARGWGPAQLTAEFDVLWAAARSEDSELIQASLYGAASSILYLNPAGPELALARWQRLLDAVENTPPRSRFGLVTNLSRIRVGKLPDTQIDRMWKLSLALPRSEGRMLFDMVVALNPDYSRLQPTIRQLILEFKARTIVPPDGSKIDQFLDALNRDGTGNPVTLETVEAIILAGHPSWTTAGFAALRKSRQLAPQLVTPIYERLKGLDDLSGKAK